MVKTQNGLAIQSDGDPTRLLKRTLPWPVLRPLSAARLFWIALIRSFWRRAIRAPLCPSLRRVWVGQRARSTITSPARKSFPRQRDAALRQFARPDVDASRRARSRLEFALCRQEVFGGRVFGRCRAQVPHDCRRVEQNPGTGPGFFRNHLGTGAKILADYLKSARQEGLLTLDNPMQAARQFMSLCDSQFAKARWCNAAPAPSAQQIEHEVQCAVRIFLAAYGAKPSS